MLRVIARALLGRYNIIMELHLIAAANKNFTTGSIYKECLDGGAL